MNGQPPAVKSINELHVDPKRTIDFLGTVDLAGGWITALESAVLIDVEGLNETALCDLIDTRSAIRAGTNVCDLAGVAVDRSSQLRCQHKPGPHNAGAPTRICSEFSESAISLVQRRRSHCSLTLGSTSQLGAGQRGC